MGRHIRDSGLRFDRVVASPATRVTETIELASKAFGRSFPVEWDRRIYLASSATLIDLLRELEGDPAAVLMVGHNPGLEDLIFDLVPDDGSSPLRDEVEVKFPTASFAVLELDIEDWADLAEGSARLTALTRPRDLDPSLGPELVA
jgi:phosphohistidine phosphatase